MSPEQLQFLLVCYRHNCAFDLVIDERQRNEMISAELIWDAGSGPERRWGLTPRGEAYVKAILSVPLPEQTWRIPWPRPEGD